MSKGLWKRKCEICGKRLPACKDRPQTYCLDCGLKRMTKAVRQLHNKKGPYYDKWKHNLKAVLE